MIKINTILNFFQYRNTNANAESFNAKIKLFRANLRGVTDIDFFLFRLKNYSLNPQLFYLTRDLQVVLLL
jgi:hypothetical protein